MKFKETAGKVFAISLIFALLIVCTNKVMAINYDKEELSDKELFEYLNISTENYKDILWVLDIVITANDKTLRGCLKSANSCLIFVS